MWLIPLLLIVGVRYLRPMVGYLATLWSGPEGREQVEELCERIFDRLAATSQRWYQAEVRGH